MKANINYTYIYAENKNILVKTIIECINEWGAIPHS
jgi:hypothetical protein